METKKMLVIAGMLLAFVGGFFLLKGAVQLLYTRIYPIKYEAIVKEAAKETGVSEALIYAVIRTESGFHPSAQSSIGARGLMQITEDTFEWARFREAGEAGDTYDEMFDPEKNILYGAHILKLLMEEFQTVDTALCAYHAGWGNVKKWLNTPENSPDGITVDNIPFSDTEQYVKKVQNTMKIYQRIYNL